MNTPFKHIADNELVNLFKTQASKHAFAELYKRYHIVITGVCMKYLLHAEDAKDMAMQVFEKAYNSMNNYEIQNFGAWIYRVAKNECLMLLRKKGSKTILTENMHLLVMENEDGLHLAQQKEVDLNHMEAALQTLPIEQKNCIELFYYQQKSYTEIQQITGFTFMQVKSYIQNAKRNLKIKISHIE